MRDKDSAIAKFWIALRSAHADMARGQEALFHQPWEREGELRWVRARGGRRLVGRGLDPAALVRRRTQEW